MLLAFPFSLACTRSPLPAELLAELFLGHAKGRHCWAWGGREPRAASSSRGHGPALPLPFTPVAVPRIRLTALSSYSMNMDVLIRIWDIGADYLIEAPKH